MAYIGLVARSCSQQWVVLHRVIKLHLDKMAFIFMNLIIFLNKVRTCNHVYFKISIMALIFCLSILIFGDILYHNARH